MYSCSSSVLRLEPLFGVQGLAKSFSVEAVLKYFALFVGSIGCTAVSPGTP